jgi:hypothetical protein
MTVEWDDVTRAEVLRAIQEYDRLGLDEFFSEHGFAPTTTYDLVWDERRTRRKQSGASRMNSPPASACLRWFRGRQDRRRKSARVSRIHHSPATTRQLEIFNAGGYKVLRVIRYEHRTALQMV